MASIFDINPSTGNIIAGVAGMISAVRMYSTVIQARETAELNARLARRNSDREREAFDRARQSIHQTAEQRVRQIPTTIRARMTAGLVAAVTAVVAVLNPFNWASTVRARIVAIVNSERVQRARANVIWLADKVNPMHLVLAPEEPTAPAASATTVPVSRTPEATPRTRNVGKIVTGLSVLGLGSFAAFVAASRLAGTIGAQLGNTPAPGTDLENAARTFTTVASSAQNSRPQ